MEYTRENLVKLIKDWLVANQVSAAYLEDVSGIPKDSVRDFMRGKTYIPRADKLQKILAVVAPEMKF